jgi:hypothetical protein
MSLGQLLLPLLAVLPAKPADIGPIAAAPRTAIEVRVRVASASPEASLDRMLREMARDRSQQSDAVSPAPRPPAAIPPKPTPEAKAPATAVPPGLDARRPPASLTSDGSANQPVNLAPARPQPPSASPARPVGSADPAKVPQQAPPRALGQQDLASNGPPPVSDAPPPGWHDPLHDKPVPPANVASPMLPRPANAPPHHDGAADVAVLAADKRNIFPPDVLQKLHAIYAARKAGQSPDGRRNDP